jgi:hypothetical protein
VIQELIYDYPQRRRFFWKSDGYPARLRRAWAVAERLQTERDTARAELAQEKTKAALLTRMVDQLEAQLAHVRRAARRRKPVEENSP